MNKILKRFSSILVSLTMLVSNAPMVSLAADVDNGNLITNGGFEDGTFRPSGTVKYGEALKLILLAADYPVQPGTDLHWAGGYLNLALQTGILPVGPVYDLDETITRQQVAQIATRALGLIVPTLKFWHCMKQVLLKAWK